MIIFPIYHFNHVYSVLETTHARDRDKIYSEKSVLKNQRASKGIKNLKSKAWEKKEIQEAKLDIWGSSSSPGNLLTLRERAAGLRLGRASDTFR